MTAEDWVTSMGAEGSGVEVMAGELIKLWAQKRRAGWLVCPPQWTPPPALLAR